MESTSPTVEDTRAAILEAARGRFRQYGYNKTTMAEIAADCGMSAANLYRYFENKLDLAAELAHGCLSQEAEALRQVVDDRGVPAAARLQSFVLTVLHCTHDTWSREPRLNELVEAVCRQKTELVSRHQQIKQSLLEKLLVDGCLSGEFAIADIPGAAVAILAATTVFDVPIFMNFHPLAEHERRAGLVVGLLLQGLLHR